MRDGMGDAMRQGVEDGFRTYERQQAMRAAEEGRLTEHALGKERKVLRSMRLYSWLAFAVMFGSVGLALYLFFTGNVGGGFGAAFVGMFFSLLHGFAAGVAKAIEDKHYYAAALDWARKEVRKGDG